MKKLLCFSVLFCFCQIYGQYSFKPEKKLFDIKAIESWPEMGNPVDDDVEFSMDGNFFCYKKKARWASEGDRLLQSVKDGNIVRSIPFNANCFFSRDSRRFFYFSNNEIVDMDVVSRKERVIKEVEDIGFPQCRKGIMMFYRVKKGMKLVIEYLSNPNRNLCFDSVTRFIISKNGEKTVFLYNKMGKQYLRCFNNENGESDDFSISSGDKIESMIFDNSCSRFLFVKKTGEHIGYDRSIWFFNFGTRQFELKADHRIAKLTENEFISSAPPNFSYDGNYIFFRAEGITLKKKGTDYAKVDVWNYLDFRLKNGCRLNKPITYTFSVSSRSTNIIRIEDDSLRLLGSVNIQGDYVIVQKPIGDRFWEVWGKRCFWIVSMKNGSRSALPIGPRLDAYFYSPGGRFLVYVDSLNDRWDYYAYDTKSGRINNLTRNLPSDQLEYIENNGKKAVGHHFLSGVEGWLDEENAVLVYDSFDLLKLYLSGEKKPENVTNGYGRRNNTRLALTYESSGTKCYKIADTLLFTAFDWKTKCNGFYSKKLNRKGDPDSLSMRPWIICGYGARLLPINDHIFDRGIRPLWAEDAKLWLVKCNSERSAPNYYLTSDLINFRKLTYVEPQSDYSWYTTELVHWTQYDGTLGSGIIYKPENFDSSKKYPIIVFHYRELSQLLHHFSIPELNDGPINIPWFVNRGYLVLAPDIYLRGDGGGPAAFNVVVSAGEWIGRLPYVDKERIGLNGHSQAGFQTNYILPRTSIFAAALSGAGGADAIMSAFIEPECGISRFSTSESRIGNIWQHPDLYIKNSPFWLADKINTPVLIFHCKKDVAVPWELAVQFFLSLWRLGKPAWMLQYDNGGHAIGNKEDLLDYSLRVDQFFDHFLKRSPPPIWMTKGLNPLNKEMTGLELDSEYINGSPR